MASALLLIGFLLVAIAEVWAMYRAFRLGVVRGVLGMLFPGYVLFLARRFGFYQSFFIVWGAGLFFMAAGTILFSLA